MRCSFLIVTKNRPEELDFTISKLLEIIDLKKDEVRVFIDGCSRTQSLIRKYDVVHWMHSKVPLGASAARHNLYKTAKGEILIGLDDDAHPISLNFTQVVSAYFQDNPSTAILAFQEVRGIYKDINQALAQCKTGENYITSEFVGCGFAIRKNIYDKTRGFPVWMSIYGEESAVSLEVLSLGFHIVYTYDIAVNHRVDVQKRKFEKRNYFRFENQLRNMFKYYVVYYRHPIKKLLKLLWHNFRKYALSDKRYFMLFFKVLFTEVSKIGQTLSYRNVVPDNVIRMKNKLHPIPFS